MVSMKVFCYLLAKSNNVYIWLVLGKTKNEIFSQLISDI